MADVSREELVDLVHQCPVDIAQKLGYDRLTDLHNEWIRDMVFGDEDKTLQAHRGSYKTTCLIVAIAFILVFFPSIRVIFMRKTDTDVTEVVAGVANVLKSKYFQALCRMLYGLRLELTRSTTTEIHTNLARGVSGASQLVGMGCGSSLTGKHADVIFTDDIINLKDRVSAAERKRIKLIYQELQNVKNRGGRIHNTGTPWHKDDAFTLMPNIVKFDCYATGLMTREEIEGQRGKMSPSLFAANYELKHIADEEAMFTAAKMFGDPTLLYEGKGHIDASYGGADGTAFTAARKIDGIWYVFGKRWNKHVDDCLGEILAYCKHLRIGTIYAEKNADKAYLVKAIRKLGHPAASYTEKQNKFIKISTHLRSEWRNVRFLDCDALPLDCEYLNEILDYTEQAEHDDAPDSLASIIRQSERAVYAQFDKKGV